MIGAAYPSPVRGEGGARPPLGGWEGEGARLLPSPSPGSAVPSPTSPQMGEVM